MAELQDGWPVRAVAAATVGYSVAITLAPRLLAKPCGLVGPTGDVPAHVAGLTRSIGVRDGAVATALALAPPGPAMTTLTAVRVAADLADAFALSRGVASRSRSKVLAAALSWGVVQVAALAAVVNARRESR